MSDLSDSTGSLVDEQRRQRAETLLMEAFADGRLREAEFERRYQQVVAATSNADVDASTNGVPPKPANPLDMNDNSSDSFPEYPGTRSPGTSDPVGGGAHGSPYGPAPTRPVEGSPYGSNPYDQNPYGASQAPYGTGTRLVPHQAGPGSEGANRATGAAAHFLALATSIVGPGIIFAISRQGSSARREAAKAFNFQVIALLALIAYTILSIFLPNFLDNIIYPLISLGWLLGTVVGGAKAAQGEDWENPVNKVVKLKILSDK